jgi:hypothetical protein
MTTPPTLSKRIIDSLISRQDEQQWEELISSLLRRLELNAADKADAEREYIALGDSIAETLSLPRHDVIVSPQGSMRTQTTIAPRYPVNFDIDVFVELAGPGYDTMAPETMFQRFGQALEGNEDVTGKREEKRRCWRLAYPGKPFYFDVTPAVRGSTYAGGTLRVRDRDKGWAPTNPGEFAEWFCGHAEERFIFATPLLKSEALVARSDVEPLPSEPVGLDDILRRTVQLMKLHRDNMYWFADQARKDAQPISIIIVTLVTQAYDELIRTQRAGFRSPLEVVLKLVEMMPQYIKRPGGTYSVPNPKLPLENFADRWNSDDGARAAEFKRWHGRLELDLEKLLHHGTKTAPEAEIREVFGNVGVEAWKLSRPKANVLDGLLASAGPLSNPAAPIKPGSSDTLG